MMTLMDTTAHITLTTPGYIIVALILFVGLGLCIFGVVTLLSASSPSDTIVGAIVSIGSIAILAVGCASQTVAMNDNTALEHTYNISSVHTTPTWGSLSTSNTVYATLNDHRRHECLENTVSSSWLLFAHKTVTLQCERSGFIPMTPQTHK